MMSEDDELTPEERAREWGVKRTWSHEVFWGDWAFKNWSISPLNVRADVPYGSAVELPRSLARIHSQVMSDSEIDLVELQQRLHTINERVAEAIEKSEAEAEACWTQRRVWVPRIDEALVADDDLAEIAIQSFDLCEEEGTEPMVAALGLWLIGEWRHETTSAGAHAGWAAENLLVVASEIGWFRGVAAEQRWNARASSERGSRAAAARHEDNRRRKEEAQHLYASRKWASKAEAARAINHHTGITEQVALRWVYEFSGTLP